MTGAAIDREAQDAMWSIASRVARVFSEATVPGAPSATLLAKCEALAEDLARNQLPSWIRHLDGHVATHRQLRGTVEQLITLGFRDRLALSAMTRVQEALDASAGCAANARELHELVGTFLALAARTGATVVELAQVAQDHLGALERVEASVREHEDLREAAAAVIAAASSIGYDPDGPSSSATNVMAVARAMDALRRRAAETDAPAFFGEPILDD